MNWKKNGKMISTSGACKITVILFALLSWSAIAAAEESAGNSEEPGAVGEFCGECIRVDAILIEGLLRTRRQVVERELIFVEGDITSEDEVEKSVQRLRNTGLFHRVEYELLDQQISAHGENSDEIQSQGRLLKLRVDERWTLAPSFRFGSGGETFLLQLGLQDINVLGSYLKAGGSYSRLGETNSFSLFFRDPRFLDRRQQFSVDGAFNNRMQTFYDGDGSLEGGYLLTRRRGGLSLSKEWRSWLRASVNTSFSADTFSFSNVSEARQIAQEERGGVPGSMQTLQVGGGVTFGRLDRDGYRYFGTDLNTQLTQFFHFGDVSPRSQRLTISLRHFVDLPRKSTLAFRAMMGFSSLESEHLQFTAGGLDAIRGTVDMRYRGPHMWRSNLEYRIPTVENSWIIVQNAFFVDAVGVTQFADSILDLTAATTGLGVRIISPTISGIVLRFDYALPILGADGPGFSFGAGQFF